MTDAELMDVLRWGLLLGIGMGVVIDRAVQEAWREFKWQQVARTLKPRCDRDLECVIGRGHRGPCDVQVDDEGSKQL